jgi:polysaccharide chain length determinant protein (PEP-CTERM system associated)
MQDILRLFFSYLSGIWRFRWIALIIAAIICPIGWFYVATLPDVYKSSAKVFVDTDSVLTPLISGLVVQTDEGRRVSMMTRVLFSRENMEKLARMTDMDLRAKTPQQMDVLVNSLKRKVNLDRQRGTSDIYNIHFQDTSPELAKRVVQSMLTIFVESNLGSTRQDQDSAEQFLQREIKDYERRMIEADRKLKDFKLRNLDFVTAKGNYYTRLKSAKDAHKAAQENLKLAQMRVQELEEQTRGVEAESEAIQQQHYREWLDASVKSVTAPHDDRIGALEAQMDDLLLKYTDLHPEVIALNRTIERLKARRDVARAEFIAVQQGSRAKGDFDNPLYKEMRLRLSEAEADVATQGANVENLAEKILELQRAVDHVLQLEGEQQQLTRDRNILEDNHSQLLTRLEKARLTREVDSSVDTVRFRILDPPKVPREPSGPNRVGISSGVFVGAIAAGIAVAFLISLLRPVFGDRRQLNEAVGVPVLGSVNMIWTSKQKRKRRIVNLAYLIGILGLVGSFTLVFTIFSLRIDVMAYLPI